MHRTVSLAPVIKRQFRLALKYDLIQMTRIRMKHDRNHTVFHLKPRRFSLHAKICQINLARGLRIIVKYKINLAGPCRYIGQKCYTGCYRRKPQRSPPCRFAVLVRAEIIFLQVFHPVINL
ncbi:MAG: hypothetical protein BWY93_02211 [Euryarchaeota archaeon ADurb.BinA087]|nr:MAG: hypothetical protein BWY93_02211 [Euryarchaeota archaeon ADurb.BinA087]